MEDKNTDQLRDFTLESLEAEDQASVSALFISS